MHHKVLTLATNCSCCRVNGTSRSQQPQRRMNPMAEATVQAPAMPPPASDQGAAVRQMQGGLDQQQRRNAPPPAPPGGAAARRERFKSVHHPNSREIIGGAKDRHSVKLTGVLYRVISPRISAGIQPAGSNHRILHAQNHHGQMLWVPQFSFSKEHGPPIRHKGFPKALDGRPRFSSPVPWNPRSAGEDPLAGIPQPLVSTGIDEVPSLLKEKVGGMRTDYQRKWAWRLEPRSSRITGGGKGTNVQHPSSPQTSSDTISIVITQVHGCVELTDSKQKRLIESNRPMLDQRKKWGLSPAAGALLRHQRAKLLTAPPVPSAPGYQMTLAKIPKLHQRPGLSSGGFPTARLQSQLAIQ